MISAAEKLEFEKAALLRDQVNELKNLTGETENNSTPSKRKKNKRK